MRVPLAIKWKSARPCTITERLLFSITFGSTVYAGSGLGSPLGKTLVSVHSTQSTLAGAWIAALTSARSKYKGVVWAWKNDPLARNYRRSEGERDQYLTGSPVRPIGSATCTKKKGSSEEPQGVQKGLLTVSKIRYRLKAGLTSSAASKIISQTSQLSSYSMVFPGSGRRP